MTNILVLPERVLPMSENETECSGDDGQFIIRININKL